MQYLRQIKAKAPAALIATVRDPSKAPEAAELADRVLKLDVSSESSIAEFAAELKKTVPHVDVRLGPGRLRLLGGARARVCLEESRKGRARERASGRGEPGQPVGRVCSRPKLSVSFVCPPCRPRHTGLFFTALLSFLPSGSRRSPSTMPASTRAAESTR